MVDETRTLQAATVNHVVDGAAIADGAFSQQSDVDNVVDNTVDQYPYANAVLNIQDLTGAPAVGSRVNLYRRALNITATSDEPQPDANYQSTFVGYFLIDAADPAATITPYLLSGIPLVPYEMEFYIENQLGVGIDATDWDIDITPYSLQPTP